MSIQPILHAVEFIKPLFNEEAYLHSCRVADICSTYTNDVETVVAALLHDVVEDTEKTLEDISMVFNDEVSYLVDGVTDVDGPNRKFRKQHTYWKTRKSTRSIIIKLSDRIDNLRRSLEDPNPRFMKMYLEEDYSFRCALWLPDCWEKAWAEYDRLIEEIKKKVN